MKKTILIDSSDLASLRQWAARLSEQEDRAISLSELLRMLSKLEPEDIKDSLLLLARKELDEQTLTSVLHGEKAHQALKKLAKNHRLRLYQLFSVFALPDFQSWAEQNFLPKYL